MNLEKLSDFILVKTPTLKQDALVDNANLESQNSKDLDTDTVLISDKAKNLLEKHKQFIEERKEFLEELENLPEQTTDPRVLCLLIAMRIMNGDKVPLKDEKFLLENDPKMHSQAILLKRSNENAKKYKSILPEEESESSPQSSVTSVSTSSASSEETSEVSEVVTDA